MSNLQPSVLINCVLIKHKKCTWGLMTLTTTKLTLTSINTDLPTPGWAIHAHLVSVLAPVGWIRLLVLRLPVRPHLLPNLGLQDEFFYAPRLPPPPPHPVDA